jgi:hypothetical protein
MARGIDDTNETLQACTPTKVDTIGMKIRPTANQTRATRGLLDWALDASDRRHDDQEWFIARPVGLVLDLDDEPNYEQYEGAVAIIGTLAAQLASSRLAITLSVDEQLLLAALLDQAFYLDDVHDRQQWPIEAAAERLYPDHDDAPDARQYDRAYGLLREVRHRLEPLPERPKIRVGDALLAEDLEDLEENEDGYRIVGVTDEAVTLVDADGVEHEVSLANVDSGEATIVHYFGDFETQPTDPAWVEKQRQQREKWSQLWAKSLQEHRARDFAAPYEQLRGELHQLDRHIDEHTRLISSFRSGSRPTGNVERSVRKQQTKIAALEAERAELMERIEAQTDELAASSDPRLVAVAAWHRAADVVTALTRKRRAALDEVDTRFCAARAAEAADAREVYHRDWQVTLQRHEPEIEAARARCKEAFQQLVDLCDELADPPRHVGDCELS